MVFNTSIKTYLKESTQNGLMKSGIVAIFSPNKTSNILNVF